MGYKSGGLSYFEDGGETTPVPATPIAGKGRYALPTPTSGVSMGEGILEAMSNLYNQKQEQQNSFLEAMKDAAAWTSGGIQGPSQALAARAQTREAQAADLFQIQSQIAQYKAAQEEQKRFEQKKKEMYSPGAPGTRTGTSDVISQMFGMPEYMRQALMNTRTQAEHDKLFAEYAKKTAEVEANPEFDVPKVPVVLQDENGNYYRDVVSVRQLRANPGRYMETQGTRQAIQSVMQPKPEGAAPAAGAQPVSVRNNNPGNLVDASGKIRTFNTLEEGQAALDQDIAAKLSGNSPAYKARFANAPVSPATLAETWSPAQAPGNSPESTSNYAKHIAKTLGIGEGDTIPDTPESRKKVAKAISEFESGQKAPEPVQLAAAPGATQTDVTAPTTGRRRPPTAGELERESEVEKQVRIQAESERLKTDKIERDKFVAESEPTRVSERKVRAERVAKMVKDDPTIVGMLTQPNVKSAIANVIQQGLSTPSGAISVKGLSEAIYQTLPSTMSTTKRREIAGYIAQMELDASQAMNGQGQISDGEREIIRAASISIEDPAEVVYKKAKMMELRQNTLQKLRDMYGTGDKYTTNFEKFKNDPAYKKISQEYEKQLRAIANEEVQFDRSQVGKQKAAPPSSGTTKSGVPWKVVPQ